MISYKLIKAHIWLLSGMFTVHICHTSVHLHNLRTQRVPEVDECAWVFAPMLHLMVPKVPLWH